MLRAAMSNSSFAGLAEPVAIEGDAALRRATAAVEAVIGEHGRIGYEHPAFESLYFIRMRRNLSISTLIDDLHGRHHLLARDLLPLLVLLSLETGLELECCKALIIDCLRNPSAGTIKVAYLKRRSRGAEHKSLRVCDGGIGTPGGLIRRLIEVTAKARRHCPSDLSLDLSLPWSAAFGHRSSAADDRCAVAHTVEVAARHYADIPSLRPLLAQDPQALWYRKTPAILAFLAFIEAEREGLTAADWRAKFGHIHARITNQVLPAFSEAAIAEARAARDTALPPVYLPPEARA